MKLQMYLSILFRVLLFPLALPAFCVLWILQPIPGYSFMSLLSDWLQGN